MGVENNDNYRNSKASLLSSNSHIGWIDVTQTGRRFGETKKTVIDYSMYTCTASEI